MLQLHQEQKNKEKNHTSFLLVLVSAAPGCHQLLDENQTLQGNKNKSSFVEAKMTQESKTDCILNDRGYKSLQSNFIMRNEVHFKKQQ